MILKILCKFSIFARSLASFCNSPGRVGGMAYNVCVSVVVAYRSRVLSTVTKRYRINVLNTLMSRHHYRNILLAAVFFVHLKFKYPTINFISI